MRNSLLQRQIQKHLGHNALGMESFFDAIEKSYANYNDQINLMQRAMQLSSDELFEANAKLRQEAESLKAVNEDLKSVLFSMNLAAEDLSDSFNPAEYIKKQSEEIVKISRQREELLKNLEKQNQELNDYAHMVSHDLKSPLRTINTLVAWIVEDSNGKLDTETQNSLGLIQYNVEKMDLLIKGILNYSSVDRQDAENRIIDFNQLLDETVQTMMVPNHIKVNIKQQMPKLEGNYYRFRQLFQNIIENAVKYNDKTDGLIEVGCDEGDKEYVFFVKDNGRGIPKAYFEKIFNIFTKLDNNDNSSGIGLSIVKKIVAYYQGRIWLESTENEGTTFYFTLPHDRAA
ncbi:sensor histidine kinase [Flavobacterium psychrotrophum]|uniref:sensor histidine kinase n=1 Tax=Flavobacterium psychrotrophum TaxID=2294119 RepID=UPI000E3134E9|nr:ATP-binding protein [Flavobacterium psychrotrophum]